MLSFTASQRQPPRFQAFLEEDLQRSLKRKVELQTASPHATKGWLRLEFYSHDDLAYIVRRSAEILHVEVDAEGSFEIARRSRGTPRIANRLLRRVRDYAQVKSDGRITLPIAQAALEMLEVDRYGFDEIDRRLLLTIIEKYEGGPVGLNTLAAVLAEEADAIEEIYEPYLMQIGFLNRTPKGRVVTHLAYEHFGMKPVES